MSDPTFETREEREAIVSWLREMDAKRPSDNFCAWIAGMIERGEHLSTESEEFHG